MIDPAKVILDGAEMLGLSGDEIADVWNRTDATIGPDVSDDEYVEIILRAFAAHALAAEAEFQAETFD